MRSGRSDVSWFLRAARVVPVIAGLLGGMIGGFAMFAIDSALTWEPTSQSPQSRPEARADNAASAVNSQPTRPVRIAVAPFRIRRPECRRRRRRRSSNTAPRRLRNRKFHLNY
jgi:hypothetical protein